MGSEVHITMVDALKLYNSLISGYQKAFSNKKGQEIQQEVSKLWKEMKKENKTLQDLASTTEKKLGEWKQIELRKKGKLFFFWSMVYIFSIV